MNNIFSSHARKEGAHPELSIIITCYNEAPHLEANTLAIWRVLDAAGIAFETIFVEDRSTDETGAIVRDFLEKHSDRSILAIFHAENQGRGAAVTDGLRSARGTYAGFLDIDLEVGPQYLPQTIEFLRAGSDAVIADRWYRPAHGGFVRMFVSKGYRLLARVLLRIPRMDTEAGYKFFRTEAIVPLLDDTRDTRWFWDTEISVLCHDSHVRIVHQPVQFVRNPQKQSTVKLLRDTKRHLRGLLTLRRSRKAHRRYA